MLATVPLLSKLAGLLTGSTAVSRISPQEAYELQQQGWSLIDVRSPGEFATGRARGAMNVPLGELSEAALVQATQSKKLLMICHSGMRSQTACGKLAACAGLETVSVDGGTVAWMKAGLPVEKGAIPK